MQIEMRSTGGVERNSTPPPPPPAAPGVLHISVKAAGNKHEAVRGDRERWEHAGSRALLIAPQTVAHF